jgi:hypothetical protein
MRLSECTVNAQAKELLGVDITVPRRVSTRNFCAMIAMHLVNMPLSKALYAAAVIHISECCCQSACCCLNHWYAPEHSHFFILWAYTVGARGALWVVLKVIPEPKTLQGTCRYYYMLQNARCSSSAASGQPGLLCVDA